MIRTITTVKEAVREWVSGFNAIPQSIIEKLMKSDWDFVREITPPSRGDRIYIFYGEYNDQYGEICCVSDEDDEVYLVCLDGENEKVEICQEDFEVESGDCLPMWGTMWTFGEGVDNWWIEDKVNLQSMADCGFRIYENDDFEYIFGIDGAGYDFYEAHWVPLYKARGLQWHDVGVESEE